jgi:hypothetical protein
MGWMAKIYYLELLHASEGTLSCWFSAALAVVNTYSSFKEVDVIKAAGRKKNAESLSQHDEKHVVCGIRVGKRKDHIEEIQVILLLTGLDIVSLNPKFVIRCR